MNKLAVNLGIIATILLLTGCTSSYISNSSTTETKSSYIINDIQNQDLDGVDESVEDVKKSVKVNKLPNTIKIPINMLYSDVKDVRYLEISEDSSLQEKLEFIIDFISQEGFNNLPITLTVEDQETAKIELVEPKDLENSRVSWKDDYLNEYTKEYTVNVIIKNVIQEGYKGTWIKNVQLYYEDELISLD